MQNVCKEYKTSVSIHKAQCVVVPFFGISKYKTSDWLRDMDD